MKKVFKILIAITAIIAGVVGGLMVYSKIKQKRADEVDAFDDDFEDDFDDEDMKEDAAAEV